MIEDYNYLLTEGRYVRLGRSVRNVLTYFVPATIDR